MCRAFSFLCLPLKGQSTEDHYHRFAQCISMSALTSAAVRVASTFYTDGTSLSTGGKAGITTALLIATFLSNVCGVKVRTSM